MKNFIIKGIQYFFMFQVSVLAAMLISLIFVLPIRLFVESDICKLWLLAVIGFILEMVFITFNFYKEKIEFRNISLIKFVCPCIIAVVLHLLISYFNGYYMYTAGISVSELGIIWQSYHSNDIITDMRDVELFRLIIPFIIILVFRVGAVFLGYYFGTKKIDSIKKNLQKSNNINDCNVN